jgi:tripartite-type tricarboxylate transporter receptor subunit TctC
VPTLKEQGFDVPPVNQLFFVSTSPGVPADRIAALSKPIEAAVVDPDFKKKMEDLGNPLTPLTREFIITENKRLRTLVAEFVAELKK